ncbi:MAG: lamin tail domain-containing protein, partial [Phycisphaerales bacterium]
MPHILKSVRTALLALVFVTSLAGSGSATCPVGDLDGDCRVGFTDLRILGDQWLGSADGSANLNGDGEVDSVDFGLLAAGWHEIGHPVIINEIHYDPDVKTQLVEYVELYNAGQIDISLAGWYFSNGISYAFPAGSTIPAGGYVVVAQNPAQVQSKFGVPGNLVFGPWQGKLSNDGERIVLRDSTDGKVDEVDYKLGFPWPTVGEPPGYSIELINPLLDNDLGGSWRPSEPESVVPPTTLIQPGATWRYLKGTSEASSPRNAWRRINFDDSSWPVGRLYIGYGENFIVTELSDMRGGYTSVFLRKTFEVTDPSAVGNLSLEAIYDDGFNAWINGIHVARANLSADEMPYNGTASSALEDHDWNKFNLPPPSTYLVAGTNVVAIQLHNASISGSSDCFLDVRLKETQASSSAGPTPGRQNTAYATDTPPHMRQVKHRPKQPKSAEDVTVTVKVTDSDGVQSVVLSYQLVYPGGYIELDDPQYQTSWLQLTMTDDGTGGDEKAHDNIYTAIAPAALHSHRLLVRYRITATDNTGLAITGPYPYDPQPNFAYFVYDGVPPWHGAVQPGTRVRTTIEYGPDVLCSIPVYHLISKKDSVEHCQWIDRYGGDLYKWNGTIVYDEEVYDHIRYRTRGGVWRYAMGKNMWKFDFNRGHSFQARDDFGKKYKTKWDKINFSACIQQGDYQHRGEHGMFEAASFKLFNLMGVEAPKTHWLHFRVIDEAAEFGPTQYDGDFWGLYMAIEQMDGRFLDEHDLPDGNLYKMEGHDGDLNNQGPTAVTDKSDLNTFKSGYYYDPNPTEFWWRQNADLERYYSYRAVVEGIHHGDIGYGKNWFFYLNPETNIWSMLPWDLDLTWANNMYGNGEDVFKSQGDIFSNPMLLVEYQNRLREFHDLLYNPEQMNALFDELASIIDDPQGGPSMVDADRAMWDYNPIMTSGYVNPSKAGAGRFYQKATTKDFPGMVKIMRDYVVSPYRAFDTYSEDPDAPNKPFAIPIGPSGYPVNALIFRTYPFYDRQGSSTFAAMKWRVAEVTDETNPTYDPGEARKYEIEAIWESPEFTDFNDIIVIPAAAVEVGHSYRVRCRMKDNTGRWSHWSNPVQFVAGGPLSAGILENLRITEVMYNPANPPAGDPTDNDDFEFIELKNIGDEALD